MDGSQTGRVAWLPHLLTNFSHHRKSTAGGGAIAGAMFIKEFTGDTPWIHLDIAGTAWQDDVKPWNAKGATGVAVQTLVDLAMKFGSNGSSAK